jgi:hypothetical protein
LKISELDSSIAEILQNYNHPLFERAFQMIEDEQFTEDNEDDQQHTFEFADK